MKIIETLQTHEPITLEYRETSRGEGYYCVATPWGNGVHFTKESAEERFLQCVEWWKAMARFRNAKATD